MGEISGRYASNSAPLLLQYDSETHDSIRGRPYRGLEVSAAVRAQLQAARAGLRKVLLGELRSLLLSLTLAFVLGQMVAWVYQRTHSGLSYARSFTQSLVLLMMIVSLVMHVIGDSIVTAFGLIGALAIIRFRSGKVTRPSRRGACSGTSTGTCTAPYTAVGDRGGGDGDRGADRGDRGAERGAERGPEQRPH